MDAQDNSLRVKSDFIECNGRNDLNLRALDNPSPARTVRREFGGVWEMSMRDVWSSRLAGMWVNRHAQNCASVENHGTLDRDH